MINRIIATINSDGKIQMSEVALSLKKKIILKKAWVIWEYYNVTASKGNYFTVDKKTDKLLTDGYYTFNDFKELIETTSNGKITVKADNGMKCTISTGNINTLVLHQNLATLLGFTGRTFLPGTVTVGDKMINVNNGLKYLTVTCDIIDKSFNFFNGKKSDILCILPVGSAGSLFGTLQKYNDIETEIAINTECIDSISFNVMDQDGKNIDKFGSILLELYIL